MFFFIFSLIPCVFALEKCTIDLNTTFAHTTVEVVCRKNETYTVIEMDPVKTGAKCLDGSNYKFLLHEGIGEGKNKFLFYFPGYAYCGNDGYDILESCYYRSFQDIGSSLAYGPNGSLSEMNSSIGYVSSDPESNPLFWNWNIFHLLYCDGTNEQGYLEEPLYYNNTPLWFRGYNNTIAAFEFARQNMSAFDAAEVILAGTSSGGISAMIWASYLRDYFPKNVRMRGISDGGLFQDIYNKVAGCFLFRFYMQNLAFFTNNSALDLYRRCPYGNDSETVWKCMIPEYIYDDLDVDFFLANSQYDQRQLNQLGVVCLFKNPLLCTPQEQKMMAHFREKHLRLALKIKNKKPSWGFWLRTCPEHTYLRSLAWYGQTMNVYNAELGNSLSLRDTLTMWLNGKHKNDTNKNVSYVDLVDWKHNPLCVYEVYNT